MLFAASAGVTIVWCASMSAMGEMPMPGGNEPESGLPIVGNGGTQFAVTVIPVDDWLAVKAK